MTTAPPNPLCHTCTHLVRQPTEPAAIKLVANNVFNCRWLPTHVFVGPAVHCQFTPSRHQPEPVHA